MANPMTFVGEFYSRPPAGMEYKALREEAHHPVPVGTQTQACSVKHGWIFGAVTEVRPALCGYIYRIVDARFPERTVEVNHWHAFYLVEKP